MGWVRKGANYGEIYAEILWSEGDPTKQGQKRKSKPYVMQYLVGGGDPSKLPEALEEKPSVVEFVPWSGGADPKRKEAITKDRKLLQQTAYTEGQAMSPILMWNTTGPKGSPGLKEERSTGIIGFFHVGSATRRNGSIFQRKMANRCPKLANPAVSHPRLEESNRLERVRELVEQHTPKLTHLA